MKAIKEERYAKLIESIKDELNTVENIVYFLEDVTVGELPDCVNWTHIYETWASIHVNWDDSDIAGYRNVGQVRKYLGKAFKYGYTSDNLASGGSFTVNYGVKDKKALRELGITSTYNISVRFDRKYKLEVKEMKQVCMELPVAMCTVEQAKKEVICFDAEGNPDLSKLTKDEAGYVQRYLARQREEED